MIDYSPFWHTLKESKENWYTLTKKHHISDSTLHRLKHKSGLRAMMKPVRPSERKLLCSGIVPCGCRIPAGYFVVMGT